MLNLVDNWYSVSLVLMLCMCCDEYVEYIIIIIMCF